MELRPYQVEAIENIRAEYRKGKRKVILQALTGLGKTVMAGEVISRTAERGGDVIFIAHRRELILQASHKLTAFGIRHSIVMPGYPAPTPFDRVHVGTIQSFAARVKKGKFSPLNVKLCVTDEGHHALAESYTKFLDLFPKAYELALTATPMRTDGRGLGRRYESIVSVMTYEEAVAGGHLVPIRYFVPSHVDVSKLKVVAGEYEQEGAEALMNNDILTGDIVQHWLKFGKGRLTICFCCSIGHSLAVRDAFILAGVKACHVDGTTPTEERDELLRAFRAGEYEVICNCAVLTEGTDIPQVSCIINAFLTRSPIKHIQTIGRGTRPFPGKEDCLALDHASNTQRLGKVEDFVEWTLEERKGANSSEEKKRKPKPVKPAAELICASCSACFSGTIVCPECGALYDLKKAPEDIFFEEGHLAEWKGSKAAADTTWLHSRVAEQEGKDAERRIQEYGMLLFHEEARGYKAGWARHSFQDKHKMAPPSITRLIPIEPDIRMAAWIKSRQIRRAKSRFVPGGRP